MAVLFYAVIHHKCIKGKAYIMNKTIHHHKIHRRQSHGFTIVELLIIIVVIAILAAISVVAYNGIQQRANDSSASNAAQQAGRKIVAFHTLEERYPESLEEVDLDSQDLEYSFSNSADPATFCVTATTNTSSFYVSSTQRSPREGGCPGHSVGGEPTNLVSSNIANWESGHYGQTAGTKMEDSRRVRYTNLVAVEPGVIYTQSTGHDSYRFILRYHGQDQSFLSSLGPVASGATITIPNNVYYISVTIYSPTDTSQTYATYQEYLNNGTLSPSITRS